MTRLPPVLSAIDLPLPELQASRLDGELFAVGAGFSPVDEIEGCAHRALALGTTLPDRMIAERRTAAWVWGAIGVAPSPPELCVAKGARLHVSGAGWTAVREVVIHPLDLTVLSGMRVTTPLRTAIDLARWTHRFDADDARTIRRLARFGEFGLADCVAALSRTRNLPGRRRTLERLRETIGAQPEFTR